MSSPRVLQPSRGRPPRGVVAVFLTILLPLLLAFVALAVDMNLANYEQTKLQNSVDAAALAAAQKIVFAVEEAGDEVGSGVDINALAAEQARITAAEIAQLNGVHVDPQLDVSFGKCQFNEETLKWEIAWGAEPYNVVGVRARRGNFEGNTEQNGPVSLLFGSNWGAMSAGSSASQEEPLDPTPDQPTATTDVGTIDRTLEIEASAVAFVESRDIVVVLDFSRSMNFDSCLNVSRLSESDVIANEWEIYQALGSPNMGPILTPTTLAEFDQTNYFQESGSNSRGFSANVTFRYDQVDVQTNRPFYKVKLYYYDYYGNANSKSVYKSTTSKSFKSTDYNSRGRRIYKVRAYENSESYVTLADLDPKDTSTSGSLNDKMAYFGLNTIAWPYPRGSWEGFLKYCRYEYRRNKSTSEYGSRMYYTGRKFRYNAAALINYLLDRQCYHHYVPQLANTPHYPFHAVKKGNSLFLNFLKDLEFGDRVGMVAYASSAKWLTGAINCTSGCSMAVDISDEPISRDFDQLDALQSHTQSGHFSWSTAMGDGILKGTQMLETKGRLGARKTMLLMTDGNANVSPYSIYEPNGFSWNLIKDADGNLYTPTGSSSGIKAKKYAIYKAFEAVQKGFKINTMSVGADSDAKLMEVIARMGGGIHIHVPGGTRIADMEEQLLLAFNRIAAKVPPPRLIDSSQIDF